MSKWNFDISQAPRGRHEDVVRMVKGKPRTVRTFVAEKIIATDGTIVTVSHWIPETERSPGRWNMFATGQEPLAWQHWPDPPKGATE